MGRNNKGLFFEYYFVVLVMRGMPNASPTSSEGLGAAEIHDAVRVLFPGLYLDRSYRLRLTTREKGRERERLLIKSYLSQYRIGRTPVPSERTRTPELFEFHGRNRWTLSDYACSEEMNQTLVAASCSEEAQARLAEAAPSEQGKAILVAAGLLPAAAKESELPFDVEHDADTKPTDVDSVLLVFVPPPDRPEMYASDPDTHLAILDWEMKDTAIRQLGEEGERYVLEVEKNRLREEHRPDLAQKVYRMVDRYGDGAGYDIASFNADGSARLIEVKTTEGDIHTPFHLTANELRFSSSTPNDYRLYRVFNFRKATCRIYELRGPLEDALSLQPILYLAWR